jgi:large subunit ribosomal protein L19e
MNLTTQKRLAAQALKCSPKRVIFDYTKLSEIKEAITSADIRALVIDGAITKKDVKGISRVRAKKRHDQRVKGRQRGDSSKKGKKTARSPRKKQWMARVRLQRDLIRTLKEKSLIENVVFRNLYQKIKGGFFRNKRHLKIYIEEHKLINDTKDAKKITKESKNKPIKNQKTE